MSIEAIWYSMYSAEGEAPACTRLARFPMQEQWELTIDLAIAFSRGQAGYRHCTISTTSEQYWYWPTGPASARPNARKQTGWWMIPDRIARRVFALNQAAVMQACHKTGRADSRDIVRVLEAWKRSGSWRKYAASITPRRELSEAMFPPLKLTKKRKAQLARLEELRAKRRAKVALAAAEVARAAAAAEEAADNEW